MSKRRRTKSTRDAPAGLLVFSPFARLSVVKFNVIEVHSRNRTLFVMKHNSNFPLSHLFVSQHDDVWDPQLMSMFKSNPMVLALV